MYEREKAKKLGISEVRRCNKIVEHRWHKFEKGRRMYEKESNSFAKPNQW